MKILVTVKRVVDYNIPVSVNADGSKVETEALKHSMNPFDEIAVEEAVRLKEKNIAEEVVVVSIGNTNTEEILRTALAMGADRAVHIHTDQRIEPLAAAKLLKVWVEKEQPSLVMMGKQAIDDDCNQTGQMLAGLLGWGQGTFAHSIDYPEASDTAKDAPDGMLPQNESIVVTREVDGGLMRVRLALPAVVTTDLRLNTPRYATLPNIMKAKSKPLEKVDAATLGVDCTLRLHYLKVEEPAKRTKGAIVPNVSTLVHSLREQKLLP